MKKFSQNPAAAVLLEREPGTFRNMTGFASFFIAILAVAAAAHGNFLECEGLLDPAAISFHVYSRNPNQLHFGSLPGTSIGRAIYDQKIIFYKAMPADIARRENQMLVFINALGLGAQRIGMFARPDGELAIATEFVEGALLKYRLDILCGVVGGKQALHHTNVGPNTYAEIRRQGRLLESYGIVAEDLQFLIRPNGQPVVIDVSEFYFAHPGKHVRNTPEQSQQMIQEYELQYGRKVGPGHPFYEKAYLPNYERLALGLKRQMERIYGSEDSPH